MFRGSAFSDPNKYIQSGYNKSLTILPTDPLLSSLSYTNTSNNIQNLFDTFVTLDQYLNNGISDNHLKSIFQIRFINLNKTLYTVKDESNQTSNKTSYKLVAKDTSSITDDDLAAAWIFVKDPNTNAYGIINVNTGWALRRTNQKPYLEYSLVDGRGRAKDSSDWFFISYNFSMNDTLLCSNDNLSFLRFDSNSSDSVCDFTNLKINLDDNNASSEYKIKIHQLPTSLQLYLPLVYCCGSFTPNTKLGNFLNNTDTNLNTAICSFMNLNSTNQVNFNEAANCNTVIDKICKLNFPSQNKPILEFDNDTYITWKTQSTSEANMCHCVVDDSYYRTKYKEELTNSYNNIINSPDSPYKKYANFLISEIDNLVYKRYPLTSDEKTKYKNTKYEIPTNPLGGDSRFSGFNGTSVAARCYDDTCRKGFKPVKEDSTITVNFPYYESIYNKDNSCGGSKSNVECNQFVFNLIENSRANLSDDQTQNCGNLTGLGEDPLITVKIDDRFECNSSNKGIQTFYCSINNPDTCKQLYISKYNKPSDITIETNSSKNYQLNGKNYDAYNAIGIPCTYISPTTPTSIPSSPTSFPSSPTSTSVPISTPTSSKNNQVIIIIVVVIVMVILSVIYLL